ncbi:MAG TPA: YIP1 family protein [Gemmatimonadales bacterium]|jgi:hypothetical protein
MTHPATDEAAGKPGAADLLEIFYAPRAVFARRRNGEFGLVYVALVVLGVIVWLATRGLMQDALDAITSAAIAKQVASGQIPAERVEAATKFAKTLSSLVLLIFYLIGPFITGLILWIVGKIAKVPAIGTVALMVATFSFFPRLIGNIASAVIAMLRPEGSIINAAQISVGPGLLLGANAGAKVIALAARLDLTLLWGVVLMAIGIQVAGKATRNQAWATAIGTWAVATVLAVVFAR